MLFQEAYSKHKVTNKQKVKAYTVQTISIKKLLWLSFRKHKPGVLLETKSFFFFGNDKTANLSRKCNSIKCVYTY